MVISYCILFAKQQQKHIKLRNKIREDLQEKQKIKCSMVFSRLQESGNYNCDNNNNPGKVQMNSRVQFIGLS